MNKEEVRKKLVSLGAERLADALLSLSLRTEEAAQCVETLLSTPEENVQRFKNMLAGLKRRRKFVDWQEAHNFARELEGILAMLREGVKAPVTGLELVGEFFACDAAVFEHCDDSDGAVGDVFRYDAKDLFVHYAAACPDKEAVSDLVFRLYAKDDYGVRMELVEAASQYLPEEEMRKLVSRFWERAKSEPAGSYRADHWWLGVELLARQLGDAALFEKACLTAHPQLSASTCMSIAEVYLETGDPEMALFWMKQIAPTDQFRAEERDQLLYAIYEQLGNREGMAETAWRLFLAHRSKATLDKLARAIGESEVDRVIGEQVQVILKEKQLSYADALFLVEVGRLEEAERYLLHHQHELNGDLYTTLVPLAKALEERRPLGATVVYRALLESILDRAQSKYYHHGVRYLRKLDSLAPMIQDWRAVLPHDRYKQKLLEAHGRKRSFWSKYRS